MKSLTRGKVHLCLLAIILSFIFTASAKAREGDKGSASRFTWWPTDSVPAPVKDRERGGYWWWPTTQLRER